MNFDILTKEDLNEFKAEIINKLSNLLSPSSDKKWLRSSEVMKMLSISTGTLQNMRINGHIAFSRIGGTLYYERADILKTLDKNKS